MAYLTGYTDPWTVVPGDEVALMVSTDQPTVDVSLVRLRHGDTSPDGPGFRTSAISSSLPQEVRGRLQEAHAGSYLVFPPTSELPLASFTLDLLLYPTLPDRGDDQGVLTRWREGTGGFGLFIDAAGRLELRVGADDQGPRLSSPRSLWLGAWYRVVASYDGTSGRAVLAYATTNAQRATWPSDGWQGELAITTRPPMTGSPILLGAGWLAGPEAKGWAEATLDAKVSSPRISGDPVPVDWQLDPDVAAPVTDPVVWWDFGRDFDSVRIHDAGPLAMHGHAINMPMKAVTSWTWMGEEVDFRLAPGQYAAIHFHSDDLDDAGWAPDLRFPIPKDLASGVYAFRLSAGDQVDHVPFYVCPRPGAASADIAYLMPTFTYLAYSDERMLWADDIRYEELTDRTIEPSPPDLTVRDHPEWGASIYDFHRDHTGVCYASRRRPIPNMRPDYRFWLTGAPRHLSADLYLTDWMEEKGHQYDVITDEHLHTHGAALLAGYRVLITGSHPEYWSAPMRAGLESFLEGGGRVMYLGGNGLYWVTSVHPESPWVIEVRRGQGGSRCWESLPGELHHASTGELGGLWRHRGRAPDGLIGVGFTAQGSGIQSPGFQRSTGSLEQRAAFIFDRVDEAEIGAYGLVMGGAAGDELDRADDASGPRGLGRPPHALVVASSAGRHSDFYLLVHEEILISVLNIGGTVHPKVRADMTFFETPAGGAVFSVGSISWMGSLSYNRYENGVSRVTDNVLRRFLDPEPFPMPEPFRGRDRSLGANRE
jgi:N,N-dimethylformamidase